MRKDSETRPSIGEIYGVLPDWAIKHFINIGKIKIEPLLDNWEQLVDAVSIDLRLGIEIKLLKPSDIPIDPQIGITEEDYEHIDLLEKGMYVFKPREFIVAKTLESITLPDDIKGNLEGKSSFARIGTGVFVSAARFDPGWNGQPVLELTQVDARPVILRPGMKICAFSFERLMASVDKPYNGRYKDGTIHSLIQKDNNDFINY